ncbi:hypothetical protein [Vulcanisaeta sp. JCM 16161]|uniref:hypothetical protein n=1 Tax=Vulcanisaeta sp. JCM 16161 TaxID=1295372 RepID=UPI001FB56538|nr:hypothetical protein [Vulcanisaeta sp. JCM 16161]
MGSQGKGSKRLRCSEPVDDPKVVEETMRLINEFLSRVERHGGVLLSDSATPFDNAINALATGCQRLRQRLGKAMTRHNQPEEGNAQHRQGNAEAIKAGKGKVA